MNINLHIGKNIPECIKFLSSVADANAIIAYGGLCKTRTNIEELHNNNIDHVIVYNIREINMLNDLGMKYIIKVKCDINDIGIKDDEFVDILNNNSCNLLNLKGVYISISKKYILEMNEFYQNGKINEVIYADVIKIINSLYNNNVFLDIIKIDINNDVHLSLQGDDQQLKNQLHNYIKTINITSHIIF